MKNQQLKQFEENINALSLRERAIVLLCVAVTTILAWTHFYAAPTLKTIDAKEQQLSDIQLQIVDLEAHNRVLENTQIINPNNQLIIDQGKMRSQLAELEMQIGSALNNFVSPTEMTSILKNFLDTKKNLSVLSAKNLPVQQIQFDREGKVVEKKNDTPEAAKENASTVFLHGLEVVFVANYFDTLEFVQTLEQINGLIWQEMDYTVDEYPLAEVRLVINTLSNSKDWIGV